MKKLFAYLVLIGTTGLASAQVSNFTGLSGAVNLSSVSSYWHEVLSFNRPTKIHLRVDFFSPTPFPDSSGSAGLSPA